MKLGTREEITVAGGRIRVRSSEYDILAVEIEGEVYAVENLCSHAGVSMHNGRLRDFTLTCPSHLAQFDVRDGAVRREPLEGDPENVCPQRVFPVTSDGELLFAEVPDGMDWKWFD